MNPSQKTTTKLLVSVRSVEEARIAFAGGATLIDVKEPSRGALGRADYDVIVAIVHEVNGRCPVSAAMGELRDDNRHDIPAGLSFVKWGLAGCASDPNWRRKWNEAASRVPSSCRAVVAAYADYELADAPSVSDVIDFACSNSGNVLLLDTCSKTHRKSLFDWLSCEELQIICHRCRAAAVRIALAGSLSLEHAAIIRELRPNWMAVRGSVCDEQKRLGAVTLERVAQLTQRLRETHVAAGISACR